MKNHRNGKSRPLSAKEAKHLLSQTGGSLCPDLTAEFFVDTYRLGDGRIMLISWEAGKGTLWDSEEDLRELMRPNVGEAASQHVLHQVFDDQFPQQVELHIGELFRAIGMKISTALFTKAEVAAIDARLSSLPEHEVLKPFIVRGIIAYVGEMIRKIIGGSWVMKKGTDDNETWEPWITARNGSEVNPFMEVLRGIDEGSDESDEPCLDGPIAAAFPDFVNRLPSN